MGALRPRLLHPPQRQKSALGRRLGLRPRIDRRRQRRQGPPPHDRRSRHRHPRHDPDPPRLRRHHRLGRAPLAHLPRCRRRPLRPANHPAGLPALRRRRAGAGPPRLPARPRSPCLDRYRRRHRPHGPLHRPQRPRPVELALLGCRRRVRLLLRRIRDPRRRPHPPLQPERRLRPPPRHGHRLPGRRDENLRRRPRRLGAQLPDRRRAGHSWCLPARLPARRKESGGHLRRRSSPPATTSSPSPTSATTPSTPSP